MIQRDHSPGPVNAEHIRPEAYLPSVQVLVRKQKTKLG